MFCKHFDEIPYEGHKYLTGQCYYAGRITDPNDRRLLQALLDHLYKGGESFGNAAVPVIYKIPECPNKEQSLDYIAGLPMDTPPELLGFHPNANYRKSVSEATNLISGTMVSQNELLERFRQQTELQANRSGLLAICESILGRIPEPINERIVLDNFPLSAPNALNIVLYNETLQYNEICKSISHSLLELSRMLRGEVSSSGELEQLLECLGKNTVPDKWTQIAFKTRKNLSGFLQELVDRIKFFKSWIEDGEPTTVWMSAFLCPQAVFEALRWNCSKHSKRPVNEVHLRMTPTMFEAKSRTTSLEFSDFCRVRMIGVVIWTNWRLICDFNYRIICEQMRISSVST